MMCTAVITGKATAGVVYCLQQLKTMKRRQVPHPRVAGLWHGNADRISLTLSHTSHNQNYAKWYVKPYHNYNTTKYNIIWWQRCSRNVYLHCIASIRSLIAFGRTLMAAHFSTRAWGNFCGSGMMCDDESSWRLDINALSTFNKNKDWNQHNK